MRQFSRLFYAGIILSGFRDVIEIRDGQTGGELELLEPAVGGDRQSSHAGTRGLYWLECYPAAVAHASRIRLPFISPDVPT